jgi:hypothetical protein
MKIVTPLFIATCLVVTWAQMAYAYMDLGTGSYIFQLLLAGFLGALFALKMYWQSAKNALRNLFSRNRNAGKRKKQ